MRPHQELCPEFGISKTIAAFRKPPCPPPTGKDILERFIDILHAQPRNCRSCDAVAFSVATELRDHWQEGDARIPLNTVPTIKKRILDLRETLRFIHQRSKKGRKDYVEAVVTSLLVHKRHFWRPLLL